MIMGVSVVWWGGWWALHCVGACTPCGVAERISSVQYMWSFLPAAKTASAPIPLLPTTWGGVGWQVAEARPNYLTSEHTKQCVPCYRSGHIYMHWAGFGPEAVTGSSSTQVRPVAGAKGTIAALKPRL